MKEILHNMANHLLVEYCRGNEIDCSDTRCVKDGRGFSYQLLRNGFVSTVPVARVTFHKSQAPTYGW